MAGRSGCSSSFSRLARRSLGLRPALSRCHQFVTRYLKASAISFPPQLLRLLPAGAVCRVGLAPTGKRRLATAHANNGLSYFGVAPIAPHVTSGVSLGTPKNRLADIQSVS